MTGRYEDLNEMQMDVLRELGSIGAGNAATSLSIMLGRPVGRNVPKVYLMQFSQVAGAVGGAEELSYGVLLRLGGEVRGIIMTLLNREFAHLILNILMNKSHQSFDELDKLSLSALAEVGNILSAAYIKSIATLTGLDIRASVPEVCIDMAGALLSVPIIEFGAVGDKVLFVEEVFTSGQDSICCHMALFAEADSFHFMLKRLGLEQ